jgi:hypothetical protein
VANNISEPIQILKYLIEIWPKSQGGLWNKQINGNNSCWRKTKCFRAKENNKNWILKSFKVIVFSLCPSVERFHEKMIKAKKIHISNYLKFSKKWLVIFVIVDQAATNLFDKVQVFVIRLIATHLFMNCCNVEKGITDLLVNYKIFDLKYLFSNFLHNGKLFFRFNLRINLNFFYLFPLKEKKNIFSRKRRFWTCLSETPDTSHHRHFLN